MFPLFYEKKKFSEFGLIDKMNNCSKSFLEFVNMIKISIEK